MSGYYLIEICQQRQMGSGLFLIETGSAFIFIGSSKPHNAVKFYDRANAENFILRYPLNRRRFLKVTEYPKAA